MTKEPDQILKTRKEWEKEGRHVSPRCKPVRTEMRDGKEAKLFSFAQTSEKWKQGETCNWTFILVKPPTQVEWLESQIKLGDAFYREHKRVELDRRKVLDRLMRETFPGYESLMVRVDAAEKKVRDLIGDVRRENQRARRRVDTDEQKQAITLAKQERSALYKERKTLSKTIWRNKNFKAKANEITSEYDSELKRIDDGYGDQYGLEWGTRGAINVVAKDLRSGAPPRLFTETSEYVYIQVQNPRTKSGGPTTWEKILSFKDSQVRGVLQGKRAIIDICFGGYGDSKRWVQCVFTMHRKRPNGERGFPIGAIVKGVRLCRRTIGYRVEWSIVFTLYRKGGFEKNRATKGYVGIDVGLGRVMPNGDVRIATWVGDDGREGFVVIPGSGEKGLPERQHEQDRLDDFAGNPSGSAVGYYKMVQVLQRHRDDNFNEMMLSLGEWCEGVELPEWIRRDTDYLHAIRSKERMLKLYDYWSKNRFDGDAAGFEILSHWRHWNDDEGKQHGELHLAAYESEMRAKFARWRKDYYYRFWSALRKEYATVVFENMKLSGLRNGNPDPDEEESHGDDHANMASLYLFRQLGGYLPEKQRHGSATLYVDPKHTTVTCHKCRNKCDFDAAKHLTHTCEHCGETWDQDINAAKNLLCESEGGEKDKNPKS